MHVSAYVAIAMRAAGSAFSAVRSKASWQGTLIFLGTLALGPDMASAEIVQVTCTRENMMAPGWDEPLSVTFDGSPNGTLVVRAPHTNLDLKGSMEIDASSGWKRIWAYEDTKAVMPDLAELDACSAASVPKDIEADADFFNVMSMSCLAKVKLGAEPVAIEASVKVLVFPENDVAVEIRRTYRDPSSGPGGVMYIQTFPDNCKLGAAE